MKRRHFLRAAGVSLCLPSLVMNAGPVGRGEQELRLSWLRNVINIPPIGSTRELFEALFKADDPAQQKAHSESFSRHASVLDAVAEHVRLLEKRLGQTDRDKLDEYFTSVRSVEKKLEMSEQWVHQAKPKPGIPMPQDKAITETLPAFLDLIALALQTDSTQVATLGIPSNLRAGDLDLGGSYHGFSHHGQATELKNGLTVIETFQMAELAHFFEKLKMLTDATGSPLSHRKTAQLRHRTNPVSDRPSTRPHVDRIVRDFEGKGWGFRDLLLLVIESQPFAGERADSNFASASSK